MHITRRTGLKGLLAGTAAVAMPAIVRADEPEIVIGAPNSVTGGLGEIGQRATWGMQIGVDQANREGGIKSLGGAKLKIIFADTTSDNPAQAASLFRRMIDQEKAVVLAGATASAATMSGQVEAEKSEIPLVTNSYADPIVTRGYKYTFKITPQGSFAWNYSMQSAVEMFKQVKGAPPKSAGIFMSNDGVGLVVQKELPIEAKRLGLTVPFSTGYQMGLSDPSVAVAPVLQHKPDMIFLGAFTNDYLLIIKALRGLGIKTPIFGAGPAAADSMGAGLGAASDRFFAPITWNWDLNVPGNKEFVAAYKAAYPNQPFPPASEMLGQGYVIIQIIRQALEKAASRDPKKIREALATQEFTNLAYPATKVKFGPDGLNIHNMQIMGEWLDGKLNTVWPPNLQTIKPSL